MWLLWECSLAGRLPLAAAAAAAAADSAGGKKVRLIAELL